MFTSNNRISFKRIIFGVFILPLSLFTFYLIYCLPFIDLMGSHKISESSKSFDINGVKIVSRTEKWGGTDESGYVATLFINGEFKDSLYGPLGIDTVWSYKGDSTVFLTRESNPNRGLMFAKRSIKTGKRIKILYYMFSNIRLYKYSPAEYNLAFTDSSYSLFYNSIDGKVNLNISQTYKVTDPKKLNKVRWSRHLIYEVNR
jgi:hypothetical protein